MRLSEQTLEEIATSILDYADDGDWVTFDTICGRVTFLPNPEFKIPAIPRSNASEREIFEDTLLVIKKCLDKGMTLGSCEKPIPIEEWGDTVSSLRAIFDETESCEKSLELVLFTIQDCRAATRVRRTPRE